MMHSALKVAVVAAVGSFFALEWVRGRLGEPSCPMPRPFTPPGYRRAAQSEVTSEMAREAARLLADKSASGGCVTNAIRKLVDSASGQQYAVVIERHYHPPGGPLKPWGDHPGATVFVPAAGP